MCDTVHTAPGRHAENGVASVACAGLMMDLGGRSSGTSSDIYGRPKAFAAAAFGPPRTALKGIARERTERTNFATAAQNSDRHSGIR
jgi:hypothetical protein